MINQPELEIFGFSYRICFKRNYLRFKARFIKNMIFIKKDEYYYGNWHVELNVFVLRR